jgi:predicted dehydrogenase
MSWFLGEKLPIRAEATGGRQRRVTGDMYDHMSITYVFENGMRGHCTSRQIGGCDNKNVCMIYGTKGYADARNSEIYDYDGTLVWKYPRPKRDDPDQTWAVPNMYQQEHIRLVHSIRTGKPVNEVEHLAYSTLMAIMGRESGYTGKFITWDQIMASDQNLRFDKNEFGTVPGFKEEIPLAGAPPKM